MEKIIVMLLRDLIISKAVTAVQVEHRLLTEEHDEQEAAKECGRHDAYMDIVDLMNGLIRNM